MYISIKEIKSDINKLLYVVNNTTDRDSYKYAMCNINLLLDIYRNLTGENYEINIKRNLLLESTYGKDKSVEDTYIDEYIKNKSFNDFVFKKVNDILSNYGEKKDIKEKDIDYEEFLSILETFLFNYDSRMYEYYNYLVKNGYVDWFTYKNRSTNETNNIFLLNKRYVLLDNDYDVEGLCTIVHEIGHAYAQSLIKDYNVSYNDCNTYYEFFSSFMERMMFFYLRDNSLYINDVNNSNYKYLTQLKMYTNDLLKFNNKSNEIIRSNKGIISTSLIYFYGEYLALIKEYDFMHNQFETKNRIKEFLKYRGSVSKAKELEILGISSFDLLSGDKVQKLLLHK